MSVFLPSFKRENWHVCELFLYFFPEEVLKFLAICIKYFNYIVAINKLSYDHSRRWRRVAENAYPEIC